jgi:hypothetical protein
MMFRRLILPSLRRRPVPRSDVSPGLDCSFIRHERQKGAFVAIRERKCRSLLKATPFRRDRA